jgi:hypothetical protein
MRNPDRIDRILKKIKIAWELDADSRFFQLIMNVERIGRAEQEKNIPSFYLEDDVFEQRLDDFIDKYRAITEQKE